MSCRFALILLTSICPLLLVVLAVPSLASVWVAAPLICGLPFLLIAAAARARRPATGGLWVVWSMLTGSWLALEWITTQSDLTLASPVQASLVVGLMLLGLGVVPMISTAWLFGRGFSSRGLSPEELKELREGSPV
jgi:hypothetical protein